jgi:hypothetical protein
VHNFDGILVESFHSRQKDVIICALDILIHICFLMEEPKKCILGCRWICYLLIQQGRSQEQEYYLKLETRCFDKLARFLDALQCVVALLFLSWKFKDLKLELEAYDLLGLQYYYLNNTIKAKYFHNKFLNKLVEPKDSLMRMFSLKALQKKDTFAQYRIPELEQFRCRVTEASITDQMIAFLPEELFNIEQMLHVRTNQKREVVKKSKK